MPKHQSFEDEVGANETFMLDGLDASKSYEDESHFGMYQELQGGGMLLGQRAMNQDVHKCSSATCERCEQARQSAFQFLPTKATPNGARMSLAGSTRAYGAEDTVEYCVMSVGFWWRNTLSVQLRELEKNKLGKTEGMHSIKPKTSS